LLLRNRWWRDLLDHISRCTGFLRAGTLDRPQQTQLARHLINALRSRTISRSGHDAPSGRARRRRGSRFGGLGCTHSGES